ncbi:MAG TPA: hypothetical protein VHV51_25495 [Polyangiaceae bacterium]|jgi:hypothetical protein|nr:hypothetical protein [Polyangiaceae bacterium]
MPNYANSLVVWALLMVFVLPPVLAWNLWDPLDTSPYLICFVFGVGCSFVAWRVWQLPRFKDRKSSMGVYVLLWAPFLAVGVGLGSNVVFDRSPSARHDTTFLGFIRYTKQPMRARLASWRKPGTDERFKCTPFGRAICFELNGGEPVTVITHHGALGWEWIADVAVRAPSAQ